MMMIDFNASVTSIFAKRKTTEPSWWLLQWLHHLSENQTLHTHITNITHWRQRLWNTREIVLPRRPSCSFHPDFLTAELHTLINEDGISQSKQCSVGSISFAITTCFSW